jgi:hypothetical protein
VLRTAIEPENQYAAPLKLLSRLSSGPVDAPSDHPASQPPSRL